MREIIKKRIAELEGQRFKLYLERDKTHRICTYQLLTNKINQVNDQINNQISVLDAYENQSRKLA